MVTIMTNTSSTHTILLTGATGKVGRRLAEELAGRSGVRALARSDASAAQLAELGIEVVRGDVADRAAVEAALVGVDALFLLTPYSLDQAELELGVLEAARAAGVERVVKLSSVLAGRGLRIMAGHEEVAQKLPGFGFEHVSVLQPDNFMDNEVGTAEALRSGVVMANSGDARFSFVDARDIAAVAAAELTSEVPVGGDLVITGGEALTYAQWGARLGAVLGIDVHHVSPTDEENEAGLLAAGLPDFYARDLTEMVSSIRSTGVSSDPTDVVGRLTGRAPRTPEEFAADVLAPLFEGAAA